MKNVGNAIPLCLNFVELVILDVLIIQETKRTNEHEQKETNKMSMKWGSHCLSQHGMIDHVFYHSNKNPKKPCLHIGCATVC